MDFFGVQYTILLYKMLLKVIFDTTAFVKFKFSNNFKPNIDETHSKQPNIHRKIRTSQWIIKISRRKSANQMSQYFSQMFVIYKKKTIS